MKNAVEGVLRVVPNDRGLALSEAESKAMLEIAFLAIAADRKLRDEELEAFRGVAGRLKALSAAAADGASGAPVSVRELDSILDGFNGDLERDVADQRLRILAAELKRPEVKALTYKVAYALALCDLDTSDEEFEFDLQLVDALGLSQDEVGDLEDEVMAAFQDA